MKLRRCGYLPVSCLRFQVFISSIPHSSSKLPLSPVPPAIMPAPNARNPRRPLSVIFDWRILSFAGADVRLVLLLRAAAMFAGARNPALLRGGASFERFFPISSPNSPTAMVFAFGCRPHLLGRAGFAYVCKLTDCDAHLVHLPARLCDSVRWLTNPGGRGPYMSSTPPSSAKPAPCPSSAPC